MRNSVWRNTRTALQSFARETRDAVYEANADIFSGYKFLATLDKRTCPVCGALDGKVFSKLSDVPKVPLHYNCRCIALAVVKGFDFSDTRASMNGQVDSKITYEQWLRAQPDDVQRDVLGTTRYKLWWAGDPLGGFIDNGRVMTIKQLAERTGGNAGGILDKSNEEQERFAKDYYEEITNCKSKSDIDKIAHNTGFPQEKVAAVRSHVFFDSHLFDNGSNEKFDLDANMALAWQRLEQGQANDSNVMLLNHEYTELAFMQKKGYTYRKAHLFSNLRYPWEYAMRGGV